MAANEKISRALNSAKTRLNQSRRAVGEQKGNLLEDNVWHAAADLEYVLFLLSMRFQTELDKSRWEPNQKVKKDKVDKTIAIVQRLLNEAEISVTNKKLLSAFQNAYIARHYLLRIQKNFAKKNREKSMREK